MKSCQYHRAVTVIIVSQSKFRYIKLSEYSSHYDLCLTALFSPPLGALQDLDQAITLSGGTGRTACQALVQRGLLRRLERQDDEARADFEKAAALGSEFARQQAVALNPYAALCNKMLSEVINKLRNPDVPQMQ